MSLAKIFTSVYQTLYTEYTLNITSPVKTATKILCSISLISVDRLLANIDLQSLLFIYHSTEADPAVLCFQSVFKGHGMFLVYCVLTIVHH